MDSVIDTVAAAKDPQWQLVVGQKDTQQQHAQKVIHNSYRCTCIGALKLVAA